MRSSEVDRLVPESQAVQFQSAIFDGATFPEPFRSELVERYPKFTQKVIQLTLKELKGLSEEEQRGSVVSQLRAVLDRFDPEPE